MCVCMFVFVSVRVDICVDSVRWHAQEHHPPPLRSGSLTGLEFTGEASLAGQQVSCSTLSRFDVDSGVEL